MIKCRKFLILGTQAIKKPITSAWKIRPLASLTALVIKSQRFLFLQVVLMLSCRI